MIDVLNKLISQSPVLPGGLALMALGWAGYQLRALPAQLWESVRGWATRVVQIRDTHPHYETWLRLLTEHAVRPGGPRTLEVRGRWDENADGQYTPHLAAGTGMFWARVRGMWCKVLVAREPTEAHRPFVPRFMITAEFAWCSRAAIVRLLDEVASLARVAEDRQLVDLYDRQGDRSTIRIPRRDPSTLCLPRGLFDLAEARLREFVGARRQYEAAGIPWRFGVLLHGPPGTGKTSLAHALASSLGLRMVVIPLADMQADHDLAEVFRAVQEQAVVLIEDIDCAFRRRDGLAISGVSFSGFLNCIDGVLAPNNGRILIMSTNHPEQLDPALVRPGRVDLRVGVPYLGRQDASDFVDRVFPHVATRHDIVNEVMGLEHPTPAMLINRMTQQRWHRPPRPEPPHCPAGPSRANASIHP